MGKYTPTDNEIEAEEFLQGRLQGNQTRLITVLSVTGLEMNWLKWSFVWSVHFCKVPGKRKKNVDIFQRDIPHSGYEVIATTENRWQHDFCPWIEIRTGIKISMKQTYQLV